MWSNRDVNLENLEIVFKQTSQKDWCLKNMLGKDVENLSMKFYDHLHYIRDVKFLNVLEHEEVTGGK